MTRKHGNPNYGLLCAHDYDRKWKCVHCGYELPKTTQDKINIVNNRIALSGDNKK